jgi:hypothetical protein
MEVEITLLRLRYSEALLLAKWLSFASYCDVPGQGNSGREQLREACDSNSRVQCLQFREKNKKPNKFFLHFLAVPACSALRCKYFTTHTVNISVR